MDSILIGAASVISHCEYGNRRFTQIASNWGYRISALDKLCVAYYLHSPVA